MIKPAKLCLSLFALFLLSACPQERRYDVTFVNNSGTDLAIQFTRLPDAESFECSENGRSRDLEWIGERRVFKEYGYWINDIRRDGYMNILVTTEKADRMYMHEPCDTFQKYVPILHRYHIPVDQLDKTNWTIVYPPEGE
jgi:hypothetical protein